MQIEESARKEGGSAVEISEILSLMGVLLGIQM